MTTIHNFLLLLQELLPGIAIILFLSGIIDNYFLTRYEGRLDRGITVWSRPLKSDEYLFLTNIQHDIVDVNKKRFGFQTIIRTSFVAAKNDAALIRFGRIGQRTSWPLVGYVDLSLPKPRLEYRLSFLMLLGTIFLVFVNVIMAMVLVLAFVFSWLFEAGGLNNYLSQKTDIYFVKQNSLS